MIEILFSESEAAAMKYAKSTIVIGGSDGPTAVWIAGKKDPPEQPFAGWMEGTSDEVICLGFMMDMGDIKEPADSLYRKEFIYSIYAQQQRKQDARHKANLQRASEFYAKELQRLKEFLDDGEAVRIWYSDAPYSLCGFYHVCRILKDYETKVSTVKLPEYVVGEKSIVSYRNWGEIEAEEFVGFLSCEKNLSKKEVDRYAFLWDILAEDNSPLRAVINGKMIGVPENFYDFLIFERLTDQPIKEAELIGAIIGQSEINVGNGWFAERIQKFIQEGKIRVVEDSDDQYARLICM